VFRASGPDIGVCKRVECNGLKIGRQRPPGWIVGFVWESETSDCLGSLSRIRRSVHQPYLHPRRDRASQTLSRPSAVAADVCPGFSGRRLHDVRRLSRLRDPPPDAAVKSRRHRSSRCRSARDGRRGSEKSIMRNVCGPAGLVDAVCPSVTSAAVPVTADRVPVAGAEVRRGGPGSGDR